MTIVQTQCCQFFKIFLIKKELMFFTNGGLCSLPRGLGRTYVQLKNLQFEKIKSKKKSYIQLEKIKTKKIKTKKLQMKVFQFHT